MNSKENYQPFIIVAFGLTVGILIVFQIYIFREPSRISAAEEADHAAIVAEGHELYKENCVSCHGENGEGGMGTTLNSKQLLSSTIDEAFFHLIRVGIPGTGMPAWGQTFGGPFTDEEAEQLVAFIRAWEPTAPEIIIAAVEPDPIRGATIYAQTCFICHGEDGLGTEFGRAINDERRLGRRDDIWYRNTISYGRPAKGMPTWGTVLSPMQIDDLVALIALWREGELVKADISLATHINNTLFALNESDKADAEYFINAAIELADDEMKEQLESIIVLVQANSLVEAQRALTTILPPEEMGRAVFIANCTGCHGADGKGSTGPNLYNNAFIQSQEDDVLMEFILGGGRTAAMNNFEGILTEDHLVNLVILLRTWQE